MKRRPLVKLKNICVVLKVVGVFKENPLVPHAFQYKNQNRKYLKSKKQVYN